MFGWVSWVGGWLDGSEDECMRWMCASMGGSVGARERWESGGGQGRMGTGCVCVGQRVVGGWVGCMSDSSISGRINKT